jgi:hypothetical protein
MAKDNEGSTAKVRRVKAKQEDLPEIKPSDRKIQEIEDLGDALADLEDEKSAITEKVKEANENLVAAMKRRDKTYYSRQTWGVVIISEAASKAKVKKSSGGADPEE